MKKIFVAVFALIVSLSVVNFGITTNKDTYAEEPETTIVETTDVHGCYHKDGFIYFVEKGVAVITGIESKQDIVTIPEKINNYTVDKVSIPGFIEVKVLNIPKTVKEILYLESVADGGSWNAKIGKIEAINVDKSNQNYSSIDGVLYNKNITKMLAYPKCRKAKKYVEPATVIGGLIDKFRDYSNCPYLEEITFSSNKNNYYIGHMAYCKNLKTINIPANVLYTSSGDYEEGSCCECTNLTNVNFGINSKVKTIAEDAFNGCSKLANINVPKSVEEIGVAAFYNCVSLQKVTLHKGLKTIKSSAFKNCKIIKSMTIPKGVKSIGKNAFEGCSSLKSVKLQKGLKTLGSHAFEKCKKMKSIKLPKGLKKIEGYTFYKCKKLKKVTIPSTVKTIGTYSFAETGFTKIKIPKNVKTIGKDAFEWCTKLKSVKLTKGLKKIKELAFYRCSKLKKIKIPKGVKTIEPLAFLDTKIKKVTIPKSVKKFSKRAFNKKCKIKRAK